MSTPPLTSPDQSTLDALLALGTSTVYEASEQDWWIDPSIRPIWPGARAVGPAFTVHTGPGDNLAIQRGVREAPRGSILVVEAEGGQFGFWGGILTEVALARGLAGLVINGTVRDIDDIQRSAFPVFATGVAMRHAAKRDPGTVGGSIALAGHVVQDGDVILADTDGVVVVPVDRVSEALADGRRRFEFELARIATIRSGEIPPMKTEDPR